MTDDRDESGVDDELLDAILDERPARDEDDARQRAPYERLIARLEVRPAAGWIDRVEAGARRTLAAERRRRQIWMGATAAGVLAAAAVALILWRSPGPGTPDDRVAVQVVSPQGSVRRGTTAVGDTLRISVPTRAAVTVVRVYRQGHLVLGCPGGEGCGRASGALTADVPLGAAGTYQIVIARSASALPPAGPGASLDGDVLALRKAGAEVDLLERIVVSP